MAKVRLALQSMSDTELLDFAKAHVQKMTGNANFPTPVPASVDFQAGVTALDTKITAQRTASAAAQQATIEKDAARADIEELFIARGRYIDGASEGDEAKIVSAGLSTRAPAVPIGLPAQPTTMVATTGDMTGTVDLSWDRVKGANSYMVQICPDPMNEVNWRFAGVAVKSSFTVGGLTSGTKYWFRVAAIGAAGQGPWSDPATKMAG